MQTFEDVTRLTPSLVFDRDFSLQDTRPVIRGLPSSRGRPPVGVLVDGVDTSSESFGVSAGGSSLLNLRSIDVERIEVVKGPQSALYGRVAFGGAVNYITKKPSNTFGVELGGEAGQYDTYEIRGAITGPLSDQFAFRINAYHAESDGYFRNEVTGNRLGGYDSDGGGVSLSFKPNDAFSALASVNYSKDNFEPSAKYYLGSVTNSYVNLPLPAGIAGVPVGAGAGVPLPAVYPAVPFGELKLPGYGVRLSRNPRTGGEYPGADLETWRGTLHIDYKLGDFATFTSISSYTKSEFSQLEDDDFYGAPYTTVPGPGGVAQGEPFQRAGEINLQDGAVEQYNQEFRLGRLEGGPFRWAVGALYWAEDYSQNSKSIVHVVPAPLSAGRNTVLADPTFPDGPGFRNTEHYSVYGIAEYDFLTNWTASAEVRVAREKYDYGFAPFFGLSPVINAQGFYPASVTLRPDPASSTSDYTTPKFLLRYKPSDDLMVYASAAKGVKPAGFSSVVTSDSRLAKYDVEELWNYELGLKSRLFDRRLTLNAAAFFMDYKGKQVSVAVPVTFTTTGFANAVKNIGGAEVKGVELDAAWTPVDRLTLTAAYTYLDAKYTDYELNINFGLVGLFANSCTPVTIGQGKFCRANLRGNRLERSPEHSFVATGRYEQPITDGLSAFVEGDLRYTSDRPVFEYNKYFIPPPNHGEHEGRPSVRQMDRPRLCRQCVR